MKSIVESIYPHSPRIIQDILITTKGYSLEINSNFTPHTERRLVKEIQKRLGYSMRIEFEFVRHIPRGPGGKLKTVISEIQTAGQA
jgi:phenylacetate-coenzyme A ligase PaaK-like adenylate-forming protein